MIPNRLFQLAGGFALQLIILESSGQLSQTSSTLRSEPCIFVSLLASAMTRRQCGEDCATWWENLSRSSGDWTVLLWGITATRKINCL